MDSLILEGFFLVRAMELIIDLLSRQLEFRFGVLKYRSVGEQMNSSRFLLRCTGHSSSSIVVYTLWYIIVHRPSPV